MKRKILVTFVISFILSYASLAQIIKWEHFGNVWGQGIKNDTHGNLLVTGFFQGTANFGGVELYSSGNWDIFIAKYNKDGACLWAKRAGGSEPDLAWEINLDAENNIYLIGEFKGQAFFDDRVLNSNSGSEDIFIAKYDSSGAIQWVRRAGGEYTDYGRDIVIDYSGNLLITGSCRGTSDFGNLQVSGPGFFVAKYASDGFCLWVKHTLIYGSTESLGLSLDSQENIYQIGYFGTAFTIGNTQLVNEGTSDGFLIKYDPSGNFLWAKRFGGSGAEFGLGIDSYPGGGVVVTGRYENTAQFGLYSLTAVGSEDVFMAKYGSDGECLWAESAGGIGYDRGQAVATNSTGDILFAGTFEGSATFGQFTLEGIGGRDSYIVSLSTNGDFNWAKQMGRGQNLEDGIYSLIPISNGDIYATGYSLIVNKLIRPVLSITSPKTGDTWIANTIQNINWDGEIDGSISVMISTDSGSNWILIDSNVNASGKNLGLIVPRKFNSSTCKIKVISNDYDLSVIMDGEFRECQ